MTCPKCGLKVAEGSNFCSHCGEVLTTQGKVAREVPDPQLRETEDAIVQAPPEKILWEENPSLLTAMPGLVAIALGMGAVLLLFYVTGLAATANANGIGGLPVIALLAGIFVLILLFTMARYYIRLRSTLYRLSTERIFMQYGLFSKRTDEVELEKYKDIFVNQDFWDKLVGCGDIQIITGDVTNPTVNIIDVRDPVAKKELIRNAARERKALLGINRREEL